VLDPLIVLIFVGVSIAVGLRSRKKASRNLAEFFLAGRTLRGWQAGTSMAATQFAADTPLVVMGLVATAGIFALWQLWIYGLAFLAMAFIFAPQWQRSGVLTDAELAEFRYGGRGALALRTIKALYYGTVINCIVLAMVLKATVAISEVFLPWHQWLPPGLHGQLVWLVNMSGVTIASGFTGADPAVASADNLISLLSILAFVCLYSLTGGLRGVVFTDVFQFALAIIGTIGYAIVAVNAAGGIGELTPRVVELYGELPGRRLLAFAPHLQGALLPFLVVISLQWLFQVNSDGTGYLAQRAMSCRSDREATAAGLTFAWLQILLRSLPWLVIAVALLIVYPFSPHDVADPSFKAQREFTFVQGVNDLLPAGVRGMLLVGMLAALASTLDTHLNWGASYWSNDVYHRLICRTWLRRDAGDRELVIVARFSNILLLVLALAIVPALDSIQQAWKLSLLLGAGVGSVLVLRWLWERINLWSELAAIAASLVAAPILLSLTHTRDDLEWVRLASMAGLSTVAAIAVTFVTPPNPDQALRRFYLRVRPVGWWRRTSRASGDDRRPLAELGSLLALMAITATSLFACLYGAGRLLIPLPAGRSLWPALALAGGIALVPVWWAMVQRRARASPA